MGRISLSIKFKNCKQRVHFLYHMLSGDFWLYQYQKVIMANRGGANLPLARVKTIMKSSPDVETVSQESLFLITRATELFIMYMAKLASRNGGEDPGVTYGDLAAVVQRKESMEFLHDILPKKIKYGEYLKMMEDEEEDDGEIF